MSHEPPSIAEVLDLVHTRLGYFQDAAMLAHTAGMLHGVAPLLLTTAQYESWVAAASKLLMILIITPDALDEKEPA